jgi:tryptophan 2,3-dioxygenase
MARVAPVFPEVVDPAGVDCSNRPRDIGTTTDASRDSAAHANAGAPQVDYAGTSNPYIDYEFVDLLHTLQAPRTPAYDET